MKTIGVIGGFGPEATAQFYLELVKKCRLSDQATQPHIIVRNVAVPKKLESDALLRGKNLALFVPLLTRAAKELEANGADFIVLPCNTLHVLADTIKTSITIPFINIIDVSVKKLQRAKIRRIGILGTSVTCQHNLFVKNDPTITCIKPTHTAQHALDSAVHHFVKTGDPKLLQHVLAKVVFAFQQHGLRDVLVACTDFHGLCPKRQGVTLHDTLDILIEATVPKVMESKE